MDYFYFSLALYNRKELIQKLKLNQNLTDKSLLWYGYKKVGIDIFSIINADFSIAFYDKREDKIIAARDPLGIKALYYIKYNGKYYFSNDIDKLFSVSKRKKKPDRESVKLFLEQQSVGYRDTMYEEVYRVPLGHCLIIKNAKEKLIRYWYPEQIETDYTISLKSAVDKFNLLLNKAIMVRTSTDTKTAYELSGGLDSSSIVSIMHTEAKDREIDSYSMCFSGLKCDEYRYIRSVEEKYNFSTSKVEVGALDYKEDFNFEFNYSATPHWPISTTFTMLFPMIEKMKKDGKEVIITGQGGDHLLAGDCSSLADILKRYAWYKLWEELKHMHFYALPFSFVCAILPLFTSRQKDRLKNILYPLLGKRNHKHPGKIEDLFQLDMLSYVKRLPVHALVSAFQTTSMDANLFHAAEIYYDVEFRHPFFDKELIEFVLSLPPEYLYTKGTTKVLLRHAMKDILPETIRLRDDKAEFSEILIQQLNKSCFRVLFSDSKLISYGLIERSELENLMDAFERKNYEKLLFFWTVVNLEYWLQSLE